MQRAQQEVLVDLKAKRLGWLAGIVVPLVLVSIPSCSPFGGLSDAYCDCTGCSDNEYDDTIDALEDEERNADNEGCEDQYADLVDCANEELECRESRAHIDGCQSECNSYINCTNINITTVVVALCSGN
jgi:hypothetical protein